MRVLLLLLSLILVLGAAFAVGWYFSGQVLIPQPYSLQAEFKILSTTPTTVTLPVINSPRQFANTRLQGQYNLLWQEGYGRLGSIVQEQGGQLTRELGDISGKAPQVGEDARLDSFVYLQNPLADHGITYEELRLSGQVGNLQTWWIPQHPETAVLMLHGRRRGDIRETLRVMPMVVEMGYSVMALSYRNHSQSDMSPDGFYHYGASEWQDVVTGLEFLAQQGIQEVVLYGFSMGGAVAMETIKRPQAGLPQIKALIMDSPLLDPREVFILGAQNMRLPLAERIVDLGLLVARFRSGIDWRNLDQRRYASQLSIPVLLIAGSGDSTIPISLVDEFAANVATIEYRRLTNVEHVEGWNQNPAAYESWVRNFLLQVAPLAR